MHLTQYNFKQFHTVTIPVDVVCAYLVGDEDGPELMVFSEAANEPYEDKP